MSFPNFSFKKIIPEFKQTKNNQMFWLKPFHKRLYVITLF